ncbi:ATP-binding cassette domain-containing protein [Blastococcus sp. VKM Ac-2987]|uniref:ATP-binding cassette domain-containing protein n=1 Tax=Blastococcus sp. VKM Ac-2987 TaxID=3004141 RepID=UPI0022AB9391|nr:ATP-binding cassette domain-containing protein [Blastococcus sp. VKM Ac-2987]MCZ2857356.1 ATP-binding cassette domain-containing protein [Blastococcus sp. VKM Ac-2987]
MESAPALEIRGLTVRYGSTVAVDDLSLTIPRGQTVALLGANGAGKSTVVNAVLGLLNPAAGSLQLLGRDPRDAVRAGSVGAMLQHGGLPTEARVGEVIDLVRRSFPTAWPLDDLVVTAGIDGLLGRPVDALSGGQRQRVLLALALAGAPPLLLLDEPTSAMDVEGRRAFWTTMRGLADRGHTVVFATHHLDEADAVADRVVVVAGGRVVADGTTAEVKAGVSGRTISFTAAPDRRLDGIPAVTAVSREGATATLVTADADTTLRALLADGGLPDLEVRGATLEDAVLSLISTRGTTPMGATR